MTDPGNIVGFPDIRRAEEEAADWLVRFEDEDMSAQEQLAFRQWLAANETNAQAYRRIAELWGALDQLSELKDYDASGPAISGGLKVICAAVFWDWRPRSLWRQVQGSWPIHPPIKSRSTRRGFPPRLASTAQLVCLTVR